jgi:hypothetical protein
MASLRAAKPKGFEEAVGDGREPVIVQSVPVLIQQLAIATRLE